MSQFPNQNIPELKKDINYVKSHFTYAEALLKNNEERNAKFTRLYNMYNGDTPPKSVQYLTQQYGKKNRTKYISYRITRPKIDLINNEFLLRPMQATVYTINATAKSNKLDNYEMLLGAKYAKEPLTKLAEAGVDPLEGMDIPEGSDEELYMSLSIKDKHEVLMQTIIDKQMPALEIKEKVTKNMQDVEIVAMCYGKIDVDYNGDENYKRIDPRQSIFEEIENDTFIERSPVMGHVEKMPIHDILMSFQLTDTQKEELENIRTNKNEYINEEKYGNNYYEQGGSVCANVIFLEWKSVEPRYYKISPKTNAQMEFDSSTDEHMLLLDTENYEKNKESYDADVAKGKYKIKTTYIETMWEAVRIGHDIIPYARKKQFIMRRVDDRKNVVGFSYVGALFNTVNGKRISLAQIMENFSNMFDITMFQILRDLNKAKGRLIAYNRAVLPKGKKVSQVMYDAFNDSFIDYDSVGATNMSGRDVDLTNMFKEFDLGLSSSFPSLIALKQEILATIDRLTGINENREGQIAASSTASNAQQSIQSSRTITEGMFYLMQLFTKRLLVKLVETTKITWGLYKTEKGKIILGEAQFKFLQLTQDIAYQDYDIELADGGRELELRNRLNRYAESALNAKDIRYKDLVKYELAPTLSAANKVLEKAFAEMDAIRVRDMQMQNKANAENQQQALQTQIGINRDNIVAKGKQEKEAIVLKGEVQKDIDNNKKRAEMISNQNDHEQERLSQQQQQNNNFA